MNRQAIRAAISSLSFQQIIAAARLILFALIALFVSSAGIGAIVAWGEHSRSQSSWNWQIDYFHYIGLGFVLLLFYMSIYSIGWLIVKKIGVRSDGSVHPTKNRLIYFLLFASVFWYLLIYPETRGGPFIHRGVLGRILNAALENYYDLTKFGVPIAIAAGFGGLWFLSEARPRITLPSGAIDVGTRNGFPALSWSQEVATTETVASDDAKFRVKFVVGFIVVGGLIGAIWVGGFDSIIAYTLIFAWIGIYGLRGAGTMRMAGESLQYIPHSPTADQRREEITPMTKRQDCEVFLKEIDGTIYFAIAQGDMINGELPVVDAVPWDSFGNFEEGSHRQWFRARGTPSDLVDWGVIVAQSNVGRVLHVAESVRSHAWLIELLVTLQNTFIAPRDKIMQDWREASQKQRAHDAPNSGGDEPSTSDAPIRAF